jgi:hypothetical protein
MHTMVRGTTSPHALVSSFMGFSLFFIGSFVPFYIAENEKADVAEHP